jgi:hypothetical protein
MFASPAGCGLPAQVIEQLRRMSRAGRWISRLGESRRRIQSEAWLAALATGGCIPAETTSRRSGRGARVAEAKSVDNLLAAVRRGRFDQRDCLFELGIRAMSARW